MSKYHLKIEDEAIVVGYGSSVSEAMKDAESDIEQKLLDHDFKDDNITFTSIVRLSFDYKDDVSYEVSFHAVLEEDW